MRMCPYFPTSLRPETELLVHLYVYGTFYGKMGLVDLYIYSIKSKSISSKVLTLSGSYF